MNSNRSILEQLAKLGAAEHAADLSEESLAVYLTQLKAFLEGQDFLRLGVGISHGQWNSVMMGVRRMRESCKKLGITCFDRLLVGIRDNAQRRNREEALQIMAQITVKRVQLRKILMAVTVSSKDDAGGAEE